MKELKLGLLYVFCMFLGVLCLTQSVNADNTIVTQGKSEVELTLKKGEPKKKTDDKDNVYTPDKAKPIKILPQTGEVIKTFMYMMVGLSLMLFFMGIVINRTNRNYIRWEY